MSRGKELAKNTIILFFGTFLPKFAGIVTIPIITNHLTKIEYGTYDLVITLVSLLLPLATLQIHSAAFRFLIDCRDNEIEKKGVITNIYLFLISVSFVALAIMYICLYKILWFTRILIVAYFFSDIFSVATQQIIRGLSMNKLFSIGALIQSIVHMLLIVLVVGFWDKGLNGSLIAIIIATNVNTGVLIIKSGLIKEIDISLRSFENILKMLKYSWPMIPNTLSNWVLNASDRFVLTFFMGLDAVAVYAAANKLSQLFTSVQGTFVFAWQENASLAVSDKCVEKYYSDMFDRIFCILTGIIALLIGISPLLFRLLIKGDYADAYSQIPILFVGVFFSALASFIGGIYVAHKKTKSVGLTTLMAAIFNLLIDIATIKFIGIYAASISTLVSYMLLTIYRMNNVKRFQPISYNILKILNCLCILFIMCIICWLDIYMTNILNFVIGCIFAIVLNRKLLRNVLSLMKSKVVK